MNKKIFKKIYKIIIKQINKTYRTKVKNISKTNTVLKTL